MRNKKFLIIVVIFILILAGILFFKGKDKDLVCHKESNEEKYQITLKFKKSRLNNVTTDIQTNNNYSIDSEKMLRDYNNLSYDEIRNKIIKDGYTCDNKKIFK